MNHYCDKCQADKFRDGTKWIYSDLNHLWVKLWMEDKFLQNGRVHSWIGICQGCNNAAIERIKNLMLMLSLLRIKPKFWVKLIRR